jgi:DASS family divalent anion:Na+ symporter
LTFPNRKTEPAGGVRLSGWWRWAAVLAPGLILYFAPLPSLTPPQRHLLAVFISTVVALVAQPVPMAVSVLISMTLLALTRTVPPGRVLSGFSDQNVWLIFTAFLFARAVTGTGFGLRVAYFFIRRFGRSALTLGYSVAASDLVLAPFIPSDTGRGGGIIYPITRSVAQAFNSEPGPTARRLGSYLIVVAFQVNCVVSAMFLTSMAANPLMAEFARKIAHVDLNWGRWAAGAALPGIVSLILIPWVIYRLYPPEIRATEAAQQLAGEELRKLGPMSVRERWLAVIMAGVMAGWVSAPWHGVPNAFVALTAVCLILLTGVMQWSDLLAETRAWDALMWFGPMLMMAGELTQSGVIGVLSGGVIGHLHGWSWGAIFMLLVPGYLYIHYTFASMTAQATALYQAFLGALVLGGCPPLVAALALGYFSSLNAGMTHYGTGAAPVFFGAGYVSQSTWWKLGFVISLLNVAIWLGLGGLWWKVLGLW